MNGGAGFEDSGKCEVQSKKRAVAKLSLATALYFLFLSTLICN